MRWIKDKRFLLSIVLITLVVILSARSYMASRVLTLNSDNAIHILMAHDLRLPSDFYFWGQDRLGSLVPILAHGLLQILPLSTVSAVSWVQYGVLLVGFLAFASLIKNPGLKVVFALIWFLPLRQLTELTTISQPYGPQMTFVGLAIGVAHRLTQSAETLKPWTRQLFISLITICWFTSIWISDFSVLLAFLFTSVVLFSAYRQTAHQPDLGRLQRFNLSRTDVINIGIVSALSVTFIVFAKLNASDHESYETFSTFPQILAVLTSLLTSFAHTISFRTSPAQSPWALTNVSMAVHGLLAVGLLGALGYMAYRLRQQRPFPVSRWTIFFFAAAIASFCLLICIRWVYLNGVNLRYFIVVYVCLWLAAIFFMDQLLATEPTILTAWGLSRATVRRLAILLACTALASSWTLPPRVYALQPPPSTIEKLQPLQTLGRAGFIGDYWASYILCTVNPDQLACSSRDRCGKTPCPPSPPNPPLRIKGVRCNRCVEQVFASDTIYLVKEKWLNQFPAEIEQFGQCLTQAGQARQVTGLTMMPYRVKNSEPVKN